MKSLTIYQKPSLVKKIGKFFLHLFFNKFTFALLVIVADLCIIYNGWLSAVALTTHFIQKFQAEDNYEYNVQFKARPLSELPVEMQIKKVFGKDYKMALAVSQAENGTRECTRVSKPNRDGSLDIGVFQINAKAHANKASISELMDCTKNILTAKQIYDRQGWNPWTVAKTGAYKRFLN